MQNKILLEVQKVLYKDIILTESEFTKGEWWIDNYGSVHFADIDIADDGHASIAHQYILVDFYNIFDIPTDSDYGLQGISENENHFKEYFVSEGVFEENEEDPKYIAFTEDPYDFVYEYSLKSKKILHHYNNDPEQLKRALSICSSGGASYDARDYAMDYLGWKRVSNNWVETKTLSSDDMTIISRGLGNILGDYDEDDDEYTINIEIRANKKILDDVPLSLIDKANPALLKKYIQSSTTYGQKLF